jgi:GNAT superfamily N-acetyltransferase
MAIELSVERHSKPGLREALIEVRDSAFDAKFRKYETTSTFAKTFFLGEYIVAWDNGVPIGYVQNQVLRYPPNQYTAEHVGGLLWARELARMGKERPLIEDKEEGRVVGLEVLSPGISSALTPRFLDAIYLAEGAVVPEHRGKGIGMSMLRKAIEIHPDCDKYGITGRYPQDKTPSIYSLLQNLSFTPLADIGPYIDGEIQRLWRLSVPAAQRS